MITGFIKGQALQISSPVIVASSIDYLEAKFAFQTGDWNDLEKWAHFTCGGVSHVIRLKDDKIGREMHLNLFAGTWKVYIHGTGKSGMRITTNEVELAVFPTGAENDEVFPTIPPSVAEQVALDAREARETAEQLMEDTQAKLEELNEAGDAARTAAKEANDAAAESRVVSEDFAKNEETREKNEQIRQKRETERSREFNTLKDDVNRATDNAYRVIDDAAYALQVTYEQLNTTREETERAKTAANAANEAAEGARAATNNANEAANRVDASVTEAEEATSKANAATERADTAAQGAETATEQANAAATNAQEATINADRATDNANEAASRANEAAQGINNKFANALKGKASGEAVAIYDISPVEHTIKAKVRSKNLFDISKVTTVNNIASLPSITEVGENFIKIKSPDNYTNNGYCPTTIKLKDICNQLKVGDTATLSFNKDRDTAGNYIYLSNYNDIWSNGKSLLITELMLNSAIVFYGSTASNDTVTISNFQIELGTVATEYSPYVDVSTVKVKAQGKNLIPYPYTDTTKTTNGVTFTDNGDGSITANGTATEANAIFNFAVSNGGLINLNTNYTLSGIEGNSKQSVFLQITVDGKANRSYDAPIVVNPINSTDTHILYCVKVGETVNNLTVYPQLEVGTTATDYELYNGESVEYTVNADGTIDNLYSIYPTTTLIADTPNVTIYAEYNKDANKVVASLEDRIATLEAMIINN